MLVTCPTSDALITGIPADEKLLCGNVAVYAIINIVINSFTIMRRTHERGTKVRLSFSGGPHTSVNMAKSMENAGSWTLSGSKEAMKVLKNFKIATTCCSEVQRSKRAISYVFSPMTFTSSILCSMFTGACGPTEKLSRTLVPRLCILHMIVKLIYYCCCCHCCCCCCCYY